MAHPVSVRLDDAVQAILEDAARDRGVGLSTYLRELAETEAKRVRRERIRAQSRAVAEHIARSDDAADFVRDWTSPTPPERRS
ncbi:ribbon-helix-helix protein, CopG family protein [Rhodospirillum centenum]|uniref:Ribbon-helix-helix protein, CopG family protein n=1 Tax=Rhodospirillum centenum (strain ATCC 51521 / SW) TaxID=414684 RepID=B6IPK1_RHOCS|nr:ribbon-helix-helix protein, CopG family protein [Rhodospirillum centenum]ACI99703.1 ribbon-helix-helix protein, CopG family protein [Rhodospirillum centenum SW]